MFLTDDSLGVIFDNLPKTFQFMFSVTCKKLRGLKKISLSSSDVSFDGELELLKRCKNINKDTWLGAIRGGHTHILNWLESNRVGDKTDTCYCECAAKHNQIESFKWLQSKGYDMGKSYSHMIKNENLEMLELLSINPLNTYFGDFCLKIGIKGKMKVLEWLHDKCGMKILYVLSGAVCHGNIHILKWFHLNNYVIPENMVVMAAINGYLEIIKYLVSIGKPIDYKVGINAHLNGHKHITQWCKDNGYNYVS